MLFLHMAWHGDGTEVFGTAWHGTAMPGNLALMRTYVFCQAVGAQNAGYRQLSLSCYRTDILIYKRLAAGLGKSRQVGGDAKSWPAKVILLKMIPARGPQTKFSCD